MTTSIRRRTALLLPVLIAAVTAACGDAEEPASETASSDSIHSVDPSILGDPRRRLTPEELERGRLDPGWRQFVQLDSVDQATATAFPESWEDISAESMSRAPMVLPISGDVAGPSVARLQIALDRALFSPGVIDGRWGKNAEKALYWLQRREGLPATGRADSATWRRLVQLVGVQGFTRSHTLTSQDVAGPFITLPEDIYAQAELDCMCYESLTEKLAERFHTTPEVLRQLNANLDLDALQAGQSLVVPEVRPPAQPAAIPGVASLVISDGGYYLHALDASGRILAHFPTTLGSDYSPSPEGQFSVTAIAESPTWHYQPSILEGVEDTDEEAMIPPGPNNAVGVVWMQLSKEHYGIHGTSEPQTIGYATSNGCVRMTNWDALFLGRQIRPGIPVHFRDVT